MPDFKTLQDRVLLNRFDDTTYRPLVKDFINDAYRKLHRRLELPSDEASTNIVTVKGTPGYVLPVAQVRVLGVSVPALQTGRLPERELRDLDARAPGEQGPPEGYVLSGGQILFDPTPDAVYTAQLDYAAGAIKLVADGDIPTLPEEYHDLLRLYATSKCYGMEDDTQLAVSWMADYEVELQHLAIDLQDPGDDGPMQVPGMWGLHGYAG